MVIYFVTLFPDELRQFFLKGLLEKAHQRNAFDLRVINLRDFADDKHQKVDDYPAGGKTGMIIKADVVARAIRSIDQYEGYRLIYTCPKGPVFDQERAKSYLKCKGLIILSGYYEGIDERIFDLFSFERVSLGDMVLTSGDIPAMAIADTVVRMLPDVLGNPDCVFNDSIASGLLEYPQYTSPREVDGAGPVPPVLRSGHHANIEAWRQREMYKQTMMKRPSLFLTKALDDNEQHCLVEVLKENDYVEDN